MTAQAYSYAECLLRVEDVTVALGGTPVLRNVDLEIRNVVRPGHTQGQVVGLLGPSGVGKTTLFRILAGLQQPDAGHVRIGPEGRPVERGMVGVVAQHYPLFAHRTVLGNLALAGRRAGLGAAEAAERGMALLRRFGVGEHARKYPSELSGGQRQRIAIAQQLLCSDHFLLMDEPFSGLDPVAVGQVVQFIQEIAESDELKTFVVVTHDIAAALEVADTIWLLGRDRDAQGGRVPGARVQAEYNLMDRGLAWRHGISNTPEFLDLVREIRETFANL